MAKATKLFVGGSLGSGRQWFSWIHIADAVGLFRWAIENSANGVYNATAPNPVRNEVLMKTLRSILRRPYSPPTPAAILRLAARFVEPDPTLALISTRALPVRALAEGYQFQFPVLMPALQDLIGD
jgi:NAD dependent epimerase/dehydratase family enzyme